MDCNKDEAIRAMEIAETKMKNSDFVGAQKIILKAQNLYPELENSSQLLSICDVHCSAQKSIFGSEKDWYGVLQVEKFADEIAIKKQYRRLALFLHPDKNRFPGAEAAFKLICEANAVLSDPHKKSIYDTKIRVMVRSAPVVPPPHHINKASQFNKHYGAEIKVSNGFHNMNQHHAFSVRQEVFFTSCPFCCFKYKLDRKFVNKTLRCQKCTKSFTGYEMSAQGDGVSNQSGNNMGDQKSKGVSASHMASQWCANRSTVQPRPGGRIERIFKDKGLAANVGRDLKAKRKDSGIKSELGGKDRSNREERKRKSKKKARQKFSSESSESDETSSESDLENVIVENYKVATNLDSGPSNAQFPRRSSRKRVKVSYNEGDDDDDLLRSQKRSDGNQLPEDNGNMQNDVLDGESLKPENQNGLPTDADAYSSESESEETRPVDPEETPQNKDFDCDEGVEAKGEGGSMSNVVTDAVEIERDAFTGDNLDEGNYQFEDPEFNDFDKDRDASCFAVNQYWACYDSADGMPRFYAKVKKVCLSPFELCITWLEADPEDDTHKKWIAEDLPVGCGNFRVGETQKISNRLTFAQQVHCEKGKRGSLIIHPRRGEVWALFKDWDLSWSSQPESHREYKYEVVEVISDFDAVAGVRVCYLDKVEGFVSLFQRSSLSVIESFMIRPNELYRFSHYIRSFIMTGSEREGVPVGSFELDLAALPPNPENLYYPGKSKMGTDTDNMEPGVNHAPKPGVGKGSFVKSESSKSVDFVDLESSEE